jgi:hypothetical protein
MDATIANPTITTDKIMKFNTSDKFDAMVAGIDKYTHSPAKPTIIAIQM